MGRRKEKEEGRRSGSKKARFERAREAREGKRAKEMGEVWIRGEGE